MHDAIDDAGVTLWMHHKTIYGAFDYYSALLDSGKDSHGEVTVRARVGGRLVGGCMTLLCRRCAF